MDNYTLFSSYSGGGLQWFAVVCGDFPASSLVTLPIVPDSGGHLRWFAVMCGGLSFSHTHNTRVWVRVRAGVRVSLVIWSG